MRGEEISSKKWLGSDEVAAAVSLGFIRVKTQCGLTDESIAEELDVQRQTVRAWRNGANEPGAIAVLRAISLWPGEFEVLVKLLHLGQPK